MNKNFFRKYFFYPVLLGASGFTTIILVFTIINVINYFLDRVSSVHLEKEDFVVAGIAFIVAGTIEYLKNFKHRQIL